MKIIKQNFILIFLAAVLFLSFINPYSLKAQQTKTNGRNSIIMAAKEIIKSAGYCALITLDGKGLPNARTMDPFPPEGNFVIWFGTNKKSRKVKEIKGNPNVTLYYAEPGGDGYVVIKGTAEIIDDKNEKEKRWKKEWEAFYPDRNKLYVLIKVTPTDMDVLSYKHGIIGDKLTWRIPHLKF